MKVIALVLLVGCGADVAPAPVTDLEQAIDAGPGCVPSTNGYRDGGDCEHQLRCPDGRHCPPHEGFYCGGSGQCVAFAQRCADLDAGPALSCF